MFRDLRVLRLRERVVPAHQERVQVRVCLSRGRVVVSRPVGESQKHGRGERRGVAFGYVDMSSTAVPYE